MSLDAVLAFDAQAKEMARVLTEIPHLIRAEIIGNACYAAAQPVKEITRSITPKDTGSLAASIDIKLLQNPDKGTAAALIGPDRNYYRGGKALGKSDDRRGAERPANYAHLVEFGHVAVAPVKGSRRKKKTARDIGFVPPRPFIRPGFAASKPLAEQIMVRQLNEGIARVPIKVTK